MYVGIIPIIISQKNNAGQENLRPLLYCNVGVENTPSTPPKSMVKNWKTFNSKYLGNHRTAEVGGGLDRCAEGWFQ